MVVLEQYVSLYEKDWRHVSLAWKYAQMLIYFGTGAAGAVAYFCWNRIQDILGERCVLYSELKFGENVTEKQGNLIVGESKFGREGFCDFCQYVPVCTVLFAAVWLTFFTMCGRGGRSGHGLPHPWRIVYPAMVFNFILFLFSLLAVIWLLDGEASFCEHFKDINNKTSCNQLAEYSLPAGEGRELLLFMFVVRFGTWGILLGWLVGAVLLLVRCSFLIDFSVVTVTVMSGDSKDQERPEGEAMKRLSDDEYDPLI